ncbi:MAG TPA: Gfo/Idh/MocA family oxidoreductase [Casimicrobiaceae bacterium]|nr:Gfo/Idh/MocA family oxidoreductase [Casimicrobiaceae bacterium]
MTTIRWGMIGCGDVAEVKSGPGFYKARDSTLAAVMRRDRARAADFARRHGVPRFHDDADAIIDADDIDAVYIATMTDSHHDYTLRCAAAGKAAYVEKPMALELAQAVEMVDACKARGVPLWVAYYRRALPRFVAVREMIADGAIGDVRMVSLRQLQAAPAPEALESHALAWRDDGARGGGLFFEGVGHTLDILDFLLGPIADVQAFADNQARAYTMEDVVVAGFRFASGVYGSGTWCYASGVAEEYVEVIGSRGTIRFSVTCPVPIRVIKPTGTTEMPIADPPHVQQPLIQSIVDEMNGEGRCPSSGETALRTARVLDAIVRGFRARRDERAE